jgi:osmotically-inducible protein OsmY
VARREHSSRATKRPDPFLTGQQEVDMKSDAQLQKDIAEELKWDLRVVDDDIAIGVHDGVVTLTGSVPNFAQRWAALKAVERVTGVRAVASELTVKMKDTHLRSDSDLAHQVANTLDWDIEVPFDSIKARVENGWVTLEGAVDWQFQRNAAERAVRYLTGVKGVSNLVQLKSHVAPSDVTQRITAALRRTADADASKIKVAAADGKVTLTGTVRSWSERMDAEHAAWGAVGVTAVDDRLAVTF